MAEENEQDRLLKRINELAHKNKSEGLTEAEKKERQRLRNEYLKNFREAFRQRLEQTKFVDKSGNDITPEKLREIQRKRGLRKD